METAIAPMTKSDYSFIRWSDKHRGRIATIKMIRYQRDCDYLRAKKIYEDCVTRQRWTI